MTTKVRTFTETPDRHNRAREFHDKVEQGARAAQVHGEETRREVEEAEGVIPAGAGAEHIGSVGQEAAGHARSHAAHRGQDTPVAPNAHGQGAPNAGNNPNVQIKR